MSTTKLRIKFGDHEFEADGPAEVVQDQLKLFMQLISPQPDRAAAGEGAGKSEPIPYHKIFRVKGRILSLGVTARIEDAPLLILFAQKVFRKNEKVTGGEIMSGLRASGLSISRSDHILKKHVAGGYVVVDGRRRSRTYRLTEAGLARAQQVAQSLIPLVEQT